MNLTDWQSSVHNGVAHLAAHDENLKPYTLLFPEPSIMPHANHYQELAESIISQQLSVKAAATITGRFVDLFGGHFPTPEQILAKDIDELRSAGLSGQKASYIRDLAAHIVDGTLSFEQLDKQSNDDIIAMVTAVKGIGEWTAHMFLIFSLGRLDVMATGDLGIRNGIKALYGLDSLPSPEEIRSIADQHSWHPYESLACWYIWKSLDNEPNQL